MCKDSLSFNDLQVINAYRAGVKRLFFDVENT
jgi:hypothetical protein